MNDTATNLPLFGQRIVLTRATAQADGFAERLRTLGAEPIECAAIRVVPPDDWQPLDTALRAAKYSWIVFTSANAVRMVQERLATLDLALPDGVRIAAVGQATARVLREVGIEPTFIPTTSTAEGLLADIGDVADQRILLPQADIARPILRDGLQTRGATVDAVIAYRTVSDPRAAELAPLLRAGAVDAITFTSSSTVSYTLAALRSTGIDHADAANLLNTTIIASIGPITSRTARDAGLSVAVEAKTHDTDGLIAALVDYFASIEHRT